MADWKIERLDTSESHTFEDFPIGLPDVSYEQPLTKHVLLDGSVKLDKTADSLIKTLTFNWEYVTRIERELLEEWADLACQMKVTWYDEDNHTHVDTGYMMLLPTRGTLFRKYAFSFMLIITSEA